MNNIFAGCSYFFEGVELIFKPKLRRFILFPVIVSLLLFTGLFFILAHYMSAFNVWVDSYLPSWLLWVNLGIWTFFFSTFFLVLLYSFVIFATIIAAPFNSLLAEKVEFYLTGKALNDDTIWHNLKDIPRIFARQLLIFGSYLPGALLILILFLIPLFQALVPFLWFLFNAKFMTLLYMDFPTDNHRIPLKVVKARLKNKKWLVLGFGISVSIVMMIPILNILAMPAAVAGATNLWLKEFADEGLQKDSK